MPQPLQCVPPDGVITGWDFSTGAVKCLAFDLDGNTLAEVRWRTDLWTEGGVSELNLMQLEGQARVTTRAIASRLREQGRLDNWAAGGISRSSVATMYQLGLVRQAGSVTVPVAASTPHGT